MYIIIYKYTLQACETCTCTFLKIHSNMDVFVKTSRIVRVVATPAARIVLRLQSPLELRSSEWHAWMVAQILGQLGGLE